MANYSNESALRQFVAFTPEEEADNRAYETSPNVRNEFETAIQSERDPQKRMVLAQAYDQDFGAQPKAASFSMDDVFAEMERGAPKARNATAQPGGDFGDMSDVFAAMDRGVKPAKQQRGTFAEIGRQLVGGLASTAPKMINQAGQAFSPEGSAAEQVFKEGAQYWGDAEAGWKPDIEGRGRVAKGFIEAAGQIGPSVAAMGLTMANPAVGAAATATLFGGSQFTETWEKAQPLVKEGKLSKDEAFMAALKTGGIEGFGETIADLMGAKFLKGGAIAIRRMFGSGGIEAAAQLAKDPRWAKRFATGAVGNTAVQSGTEFGQGYGEAAVERDAGISQDDPMQVGLHGAEIGGYQSILMLPLGLPGSVRAARQREAAGKVIDDPSAPPELRQRAADFMRDEMTQNGGVSAEEANQWRDEQMSRRAPVEPMAPDAQQQDEPSPAGLLGYQAGPPLVVFPDGSSMTGAEAEQRRLDAMIQPSSPRAELEAILNDDRPVEEILAEQAQQLDPEFADLQKQEESDLAYRRREMADEQIKQRDLAQVAEESALPVALYNAEVGDRVAAVADASGEPTAMQLAMQRARQPKKPAGDGTRAAPVKAETAEHIKIAEQQVDTSPTEAMKDAGNYKLGHLQLQGMDIAIENPAGSVRSGVGKDGKPWANVINNTYGYIKGAEAKDGDKLDVFIGPNPQSQVVFVIDQIDPDTGRYDEGKVMLGFNSTDEARAAYLSNYDAGWRGLGDITPMVMPAFKAWIAKGDTRKALSYDEKVAIAQRKADAEQIDLLNRQANEPAAPSVQTPVPPAQPEPMAAAAPTPKQLEMKARAARRNQEGSTNAQAPEAQQSPAALQDMPQAAPEAGALPGQLAQPPAVREQLSVEFGGQRYPVESLQDASEKWEQFRDATGAGFSEIGSNMPVFDQTGRQVASVSYNGKVWAGSEYDANAEPVYVPKGQEAIRADEAPIVTAQSDNPTNLSAITGEISTPAAPAQSITRTKAGKLDIAGFSREDVAGSLKTAGIKATVAVGKDGRVLVTAVGRTGNAMPMPVKQQNAIRKALLGAEAKPKKARAYTGNLRNDVNLIAPGLYAEVARGGDGEAMGIDMSMVAEQLRGEGFMLPATETGKDSDAVIELIRQDIANGGGTLNERRQTEAMDSEEKKAARVEMLRLADEYGIETRVGITWRAADAVLSEIEAAITKEIGIQGRDIAAITKDGVAAGAFTAEEAKQLAIDIASGYRGDQRRDARVVMYREIAEKLQERINEHESAASRETGGRSGESARTAAEDEARPAFDLAGQSEEEIRAEQERVAAAEAQRLKDEQAAENKRQADAERGSFNLTGSDRPADTMAAQGQGGLFDAPAAEPQPAEPKTIADASPADLLRAAADKMDAEARPKVATEGGKPLATQEVGAGETAPQGKETPASLPSEEGKERIADFGEKIGGARKDVWSGYKDKLKGAESIDIKAEPLSKSWPAPDYQALIDAGADPWSVAFARAARDEVPRKPSASWKLKSWVANVTLLRGITSKLMGGEISTDRAQTLLAEASKTSRGLSDIAGRIELYMLVGHRQSLDGVSISVGQYGVHNGIHYDKPKTIWSVSKEAAASAWSNWPRELAIGDTRKEAMENFKAAYDKLDITPAATKAATFDIYVKFGEKTYFIGKKVGRNHVDLAGPFDTVKEARAHRTEHEADLVAKLEKFKEIPKLRRDVNQPRVGEDMRGGADVTQALFAETFGFKGVEFGNWVEQARRQKDLNDAFDALMDMAAVLGIPPKALSLNGELGLAFGARGTGGIDAAAAHYESDKIVINLTKKSGEGSLGHEFFHALDNYFSRLRGKGRDFTTEALDVSLAGRKSPYHSDGAIRKEMIEAFGTVMRAIRSTALKARSSKLDAKRSKEYWTTDREMAARAFESYLISKLHDNNASNDYLSNIVDEVTWKAAEKLGFELDESYPYPTAGEVPVIRAAFDEFFTVIQTKETDKGIALESRTQALSDSEDGLSSDYGLPTRNLDGSLDATTLRDLRREAAGLESPERGTFLTVTADGRAVATGQPGTRVPETFTRFSEKHGLTFDARRVLAKTIGSVGKPVGDRNVGPGNRGTITAMSEPMPIEYRESGAMYFGEQGAFIDRTGKTLFSKNAATITNETPATIRAGLSRSLGKATVDRLEQSGLLRILDTADSLPDGLTISDTGTALYDGKTAYIIADRTKPAEAIKAVLHEIGEHHGLEGMLGEKGYKTLTNRVRFMEKAGNRRVGEAFAFVRDAYPEYDEKTDPRFMKEVLANIGQDADVRAKPWWKEMIAAVRRWLVKLGYGGLIKTSDIEDMVLRSLKVAAGENQSEDSRGMVEAMASKVGAGGTAIPQSVQDSALRAAKKEQDYIDNTDLQEEIRSVSEGGNVDLSSITGPEYWDAENEEFTDSGFKEVDRLTEQQARDVAQREGAELRKIINVAPNQEKFTDALDEVLKEGAPTPDSGELGSRSLSNQDAGAVSLRADKSGQLTEPAQSGSGAGSSTMLSEKVGAGNTAILESRIIGDSGRQYTPDQQAMFKQTGREVDQVTILGKLREWASVNWRQGLFDQFQPVRAISDKGYTLLRLSKGATGAFEAFMQHGKLSLKDGAYDADTSGGVMQEVFFPLGKETTDFLYWIAGNRAERLAMEGKERLFSAQDIAAAKSLSAGTLDFDYVLSSGRTTRSRLLAYRDSLDKFNAFNKNVMDMAEQSGLIDGASRHLWEHEFYVPFYRLVDDTDGGVRGMNIKQGVVRQQAFKKLKGGKEGLNDLLANTLMNWAHLIDASAKNRGAMETLKAAARLGAAQPAQAGDKNTVWYMDGGKKAEYTIDDPELLVALNALDYSGLRGPIMDALQKPKHWLTIGVTASPFFKIRNLIRDSVQAVATSGLSYNVAGNIVNGINLTNRDRQEYVSALAGGGLIRFGTMLEGNEAARTRQLIKKGAKDEHILNNEGKIRAFYDKYLEPGISAYNEIGNRGEEINRMSLYDQMIKSGADHATASLMARDLLDFSMQGSWTSIRFLAQVVPFLNARLEGMYKLGRAAKSDPAKFGAVLGAVALFSLALLAAYSDDNDWKKREDWDRDNYWWFKVGGVAFRIPKPFEIGAIATLAERSAELMFDKEMTGKRFRQVTTKLLADQLSMNPTPQLVKPILDIYANKDSFSGRPIETMGMERLDKERRFTSSTSMPARGLSTATGGVLSPVQIDHLVRGYFAWLGAFAVGTADLAVRMASDGPDRPSRDYWKFATGGMIAETDSASSRYVSQMYDQAKEIETAYGTWRDMSKQASQMQGAARQDALKDAQAYRKANADKIAKHSQVGAVKRQISAMNERIRVIERSDKTADEKRALINNIQKLKDQAARRVVATRRD